MSTTKTILAGLVVGALALLLTMPELRSAVSITPGVIAGSSSSTTVNNFFTTNLTVYENSYFETNFINQAFVTNITVYETQFVNNVFATNLTVYENTYIGKNTFITNLIVYQTNIINQAIVTNLTVYENTYLNETFITNLTVFETNFFNYTFTTNLTVLESNYVNNSFVTNQYVFQTNYVNTSYTTNLFVENLINTGGLTVESNATINNLVVQGASSMEMTNIPGTVIAFRGWATNDVAASTTYTFSGLVAGAFMRVSLTNTSDNLITNTFTGALFSDSLTESMEMLPHEWVHYGFAYDGQVLHASFSGTNFVDSVLTNDLVYTGDLLVLSNAFVSALLATNTVTTGDLLVNSNAYINTLYATNFPGIQPGDESLTNLAAISFAEGDLLVYTNGALRKIPVGSAGQVLKVSGSYPIWDTDATGGAASETFGELLITNSLRVVKQVLAYSGATNVWVDFDAGSAFLLTVTNTSHIIFTNVPGTTRDQVINIDFLIDTTGGYDVSFDYHVMWPGGTASTVTTNASAWDVLSFKPGPWGTNEVAAVAQQAFQ